MKTAQKILLSSIASATLLFGSGTYDLTLTAGGGETFNDLNHDDHKNLGLRFAIPNGMAMESIFDKIEFIYERTNGADFENTNLETNINRYSVNFLSEFKDYGKLVPYIMTGVGYEDFSKEYLNTNSSAVVNLGAGVKYMLDENWNLRAELRDQLNIESDRENTLIYSVGLGYSFGKGAKVQPITPLDDDNDGVPNGNDNCKNSPAGAIVDASGCCLDSDNDGVVDHQDNCKNSPQGAIVDANGCCVDSDKDGVVDHNDNCKNSPVGAIVDANGCCKDSDNDGIKDHLDKCPATPSEFRVDQTGCALSYTFNVQFDTNKDIVKDKYNESFEKFVKFMDIKPNYKAQIQGYTDSDGSATYNKNLSQKRADAVKNKLIDLGVQSDRLTSKGYGESNPIASNKTKEGKALNRRVEAVLIK